MTLMKTVAAHLAAAFLLASAPVVVEADNKTNTSGFSTQSGRSSSQKVIGGLDLRQAPTAGVAGPRQITAGANDRARTDSAMNVTEPGGGTGTGPGGFTFPGESVTLPTCGDPTAINFGQVGNCTYPSCGAKPSDEVRSVGCPAGQTGDKIEARTYASAPHPTCWTPSAWVEVLNTCASACPAKPADEQRSVACPWGQSGTITERRTYTSSPAPTCWTASAWTQVSNTCVQACAAQPASESRVLACPSGQIGSITEMRGYTAAPHPTCWTPTAWMQTSNTCVNACPTKPSDETRTLNCPTGQAGSISQRRSYVSAPHPTCWTAGTWTTVSNTCTTVSACGPQPLPEQRTSACPSGQKGTVTEQRTYYSVAAPTCWSPSGWKVISSTCSGGEVILPPGPGPGDPVFSTRND